MITNMSFISDSANTSGISSLAHNISHAVFRVSRLIRNKHLKSELEQAAVLLVVELKESAVSTLDRLVALANSVGEMNDVNSTVLRRELDNLYGMISLQSAREGISQEAVYLGDIFGIKKQQEPVGQSGNTRQDRNNRTSIGSDERQSAILNAIRQLPNGCRMQDLMRAFPQTSERTIRNDIQALIRNGLVERRGGKAGPASHFVAINSEVSGEKEMTQETDRILLPAAGYFESGSGVDNSEV